MNEFGKAFGGTATDPLGGTVQGDVFGIFIFELAEPLKQIVILAVGNLRIVLQIVEVFVAMNLAAQVADCSLDRLLFLQTCSRTTSELQTSAAAACRAPSLAFGALTIIIRIKQIPVQGAVERAADQTRAQSF